MSSAYHTVNAFLFARDADGVIAFLTEVFGGTATERITRPDGTVGHAEVVVGDSVVMVSGESAEFPARPGCLYVFVPDVDAVVDRARGAGASVVREPRDQFYGNREAGVADAQGNLWWIATPTEDVPPGEVQRRWREISPTA